MKVVLSAAALAAALSCTATGPAAAEETGISGMVEYAAPEVEKTELGGTTVLDFRMPGTIAGDVDEMSEQVQHVCFGTMSQTEGGGIGHGAGYCVQTDADGDVWWITWKGVPGDTAWNMAGGTGKYEGVSGSGTTTLVTQNDDGSSVVRYEGTMITP